MGQEDSIPLQEPHSARNYSLKRQINRQQNVRFESQGILKLRSTPFPNCVEIQNDGQPLFLENAQTTLHDLIQSRLYTNRLFPCEDIEHLIQNIVYTLAHMSEENYVYKNLNSSNIYYTSGQFKLLPNQLIEGTFYQQACEYIQNKKNEDQLIYLSPQLIIAMRMQEKQIADYEILQKSNIFIFGLIILEAATLMPSSQCFDAISYDIFNNVINERLELVEEHYNEQIARIVANMLDYDYSERMSPKEMAIWINRELASNTSSPPTKLSPKKPKIMLSHPEPAKSRCLPHQISQGDLDIDNIGEDIKNNEDNEFEEQVKKNYSRSNLIYIHGYEDSGVCKNECNQWNRNFEGKQNQPRNSIYLNHPTEQENQSYESKSLNKYEETRNMKERRRHQEEGRKRYEDEGRKQRRYQNEGKKYYDEGRKQRNYQNEGKKYYDEGRKQKRYQDEGRRRYEDEGRKQRRHCNYDYEVNSYGKLPQRTTKNYNYDYTKNKENDKMDLDGRNHQFRDIGNIRGAFSKKSQNINLDPFTKYHEAKNQNSKQNHNKYFPSLEQAERHTETITKRLNRHPEVNLHHKNNYHHKSNNTHEREQFSSKSSDNPMYDGSLNRIRMEVQKSRKVMQQLLKNEGIAN